MGMVNEAEKYKAEDEKQRDRISAKNGLESYCFNMKSTMDEEKVKSAISESDKKKIEDACDECIKWLDGNQMGEKDEYEDKQEEDRGCMRRVHQVVGRQPDGGEGRVRGQAEGRSRMHATSASSGWTATRWGRRTSTRTSRRRWRPFATQSFRASTAEQEVERLMVVCQEEVCQVVCQEEVCQVLEELLPLVVALGQLSRKWTKPVVILLLLLRVFRYKK